MINFETKYKKYIFENKNNGNKLSEKIIEIENRENRKIIKTDNEAVMEIKKNLKRIEKQFIDFLKDEKLISNSEIKNNGNFLDALDDFVKLGNSNYGEDLGIYESNNVDIENDLIKNKTIMTFVEKEKLRRQQKANNKNSIYR